MERKTNLFYAPKVLWTISKLIQGKGTTPRLWFWGGMFVKKALNICFNGTIIHCETVFSYPFKQSKVRDFAGKYGKLHNY